MRSKGLKKMRLYIKYRMNSDMNKRDLKKLTKAQLIRLLLKQEKNGQAQKQIANEFENSIVSPPKQEESLPRKSVNNYEPPEQSRDRQKKQRTPKSTRKPPPPPKPFSTMTYSKPKTKALRNSKIINVRSRQNKKFKSFTNEFKVKILKKLDEVNEIYHIFQELIKNIKRKRNLSNNNRLRLVIQNEELPKAISTKFNKVQDFKLGALEQVMKILEYRDIPLENCKIVV